MALTLEQLHQIRERAECLIDQAEVEAAIDQMAKQLTQRFSQSNPILLCVMKGGLILTSKLMQRLDFPLELDYVHATRYLMETEGNKKIEWLARPSLELQGRTVILVDDILDVGLTLKAVLESPELAVAKERYCAVLIDKQHERKADPNFKADCVGMTVEDRFLFGYGMDFLGYFRSAPGIFAVDDASLKMTGFAQ